MSSVLEPLARSYHAAIRAGQNMLVWGGKGEQLRPSVVERFDVLSTVWQEPQRLNGPSLPEGINDMAVACDGERAYMLGGMSGPRYSRDRHHKLYEVDLTSLDCKELVPAKGSAPLPSARSGSMVMGFGRKLIVYGGYTDDGRSNERRLHVLDLDTKICTAQTTTGDEPPSLNGCTLTLIDQHKAVLFGGYDGHEYRNDTYLLDMEKWRWSKVGIVGQKPPARRHHAACRITGTLAGDHPMVMVIGGVGKTMFSDVWLLDVAKGSWCEVNLPTGINPVYGHTAVAFGYGPDFKVVVMFGGKKSAALGDEISWTTLLLLSPTRSGSWVVDRVVGPQALRAPDDTLREQMRRLQLYQPLTDKRAQEIIDKALETSSVKMRNLVCIITGLMGSGKTWLLCRLFNKTPPSTYTSTGIAEQSFRGLLHHMMSLHSWQQFSHKNVLEFLGAHFHEELPPADVVQLAAKIASADLRQPATTTELAPVPVPIAVPPPPIDASHDTSQDRKSTTSQSIVGIVKTNSKSSHILSMLELVHMIDTGGQPEFMETMPNLVHNCHLALLVLNLMFGLDECPPIDYHEKGKAYKRALRSQHSNRQIIQKLACTLQAKRYSCREGQRFRLLVVATHKDKVTGDLAARITAFDEALRDILLPACNADLIRFSANMIPFVLNLKDPDSDDETNLEFIRTQISKSDVGEIINVPGCFLVFEQELVELAQRKGRDVLSLDDCLQVGSKLKMKAEVVKAALIFFHRQNTFLYFQDVLSHLVFTKPQLPLDCINAVVQFRYKVNSGEVKGVTERFAASLRDGIITEEVLSHDLLSECFIRGLYEPHHAIDLLSHTFTIAELSREPQLKMGSPGVQLMTTPSGKKREREYLMMSLRSAISDEELAQHITASSEIAPLVVKFSKDCVPLGCFSSTISCLLTMYNWRLRKSKDGSPKCLAHNAVSLSGPQLPAQIIIVDTGHSFEIHLNASRGTDHDDYPKICFQVQETIFTAIAQVFNIMQLTEIEVSSAFHCTCEEASKNHTASAFFFNSKWFLRCSNTEEGVGTAQLKHTVWLDTPIMVKEEPSLPKLFRFDVPTKVGANYREFGTLLLNDKNGCRVDAMEVNCQGKCDRIVTKILQEWLNFMGEPVTWNILIETLKLCKLTLLADHIRKNTQ